MKVIHQCLERRVHEFNRKYKRDGNRNDCPPNQRRPQQEKNSDDASSEHSLHMETALALPVLLDASSSLATPPVSESTASKDSSFDPWVEIHRENLRHNVQEISRRAESRPILAVIKNNGYGMGVTNVAQLLEPQPRIFGFAVVKLADRDVDDHLAELVRVARALLAIAFFHHKLSMSHVSGRSQYACGRSCST